MKGEHNNMALNVFQNYENFMKIRDLLPDEIISSRRWVCYKIVDRNGHKSKPPVSPVEGEKIGCNNPESWATFDEAAAYCVSHHLAGVGIMLNDDGVCAIDIDDCIDDEGNMTLYASRIIERFDSYAEISISGKGVHILCMCDPGMKINCNLRNLPNGNKLEMASYNKYITISGNCIHAMDDVWDCTEDFITLYRHQVALNEAGKSTSKSVQKRTVEINKKVAVANSIYLTEEDLQVLDMISRSRDEKAKKLLYEQSDINASEADYRLCLRLLYWCHQNEDQVDRIFRNSVRMRDKWDQAYSDGTTYGQRTIKKAKANYVQY